MKAGTHKKTFANPKKMKMLFKHLNNVVYDNTLFEPEIMQTINLSEMLGIVHLSRDKKKKLKRVKNFNSLFSFPYFVGLCWGDSIAVLESQSDNDFLDTLAHEIVHVWQFQNGLEMNHGKQFKKMLKKSREALFLE